MYTYNQANGYISQDGHLLGQGYSGHGNGLNNPALEQVPSTGPIPRGLWEFGQAVNHPHLGPVAIPITPKDGTNTYGRGGFFAHGDEVGHVGENIASHGCIIAARGIRDHIEAGTDKDLEVV